MASIPFFGGFGGGAGLANGIYIGIIIVGCLLVFGLLIWLMLFLTTERLRIAIDGVKGKVITGRVYKKHGQRFVRLRGLDTPLVYPSDKCVIPMSKTMNLAFARQTGDDLAFYDLSDDALKIGDNRLMRQQHSLMKKEIDDKYNTQSWFAKNTTVIMLGIFGIMVIMIMIIARKAVCG